jgi:hypothetical protein
MPESCVACQSAEKGCVRVGGQPVPFVPKFRYFTRDEFPRRPTKILVVGRAEFLDFLSGQLYGIPAGRDCSKWNSSLQADFDSIKPVAILVIQSQLGTVQNGLWSEILDVERECAASRFLMC